MISPKVLRALADSGASTDMILAAVEADRQEEMDRVLSKRMRDAERKREQRARDKASEMSRGHDVTSTDSDGQGVTKEIPPTPPKENTPISSLRSDMAASDPRKLLFSEGLAILQSLTGRTEGRLRPIVGRWLSVCDDDALRVMTVVAKAARDRPADPIAWIERHFQSRAPPGNVASFNGNRNTGYARSTSQIARELSAELERIEDERGDENSFAIARSLPGSQR